MGAKPAKRRILITNALPYANGELHLGHMVGYIQADVYARFLKLQQHDVRYISGSDSHGTPIMIQAEKENLSPEAMIKRIQASHEKDFQAFYIDFDQYHTTHSPENQHFVELIFNRQNRAGHIEKRVIQQAFDPVKNMFLPDRYIKGECPKCHAKDQYGDNCEQCGATYSPTDLLHPYSTLSGAPPIQKESLHYFFKLNDFHDFLQNWIKQGHLQKEITNKLDEWFAAGLKDWDISRDAPYFGFKIPNESDKYFYVWLDAPIGYIASFFAHMKQQQYDDFDQYWGKDSDVELIQFIGKDIVYFHALFWPALLHGADLRTPTQIVANGFLTVNGQKMSKSRGTFIKARTFLTHFPAEFLRYYFASKLSHRVEDVDLQLDDFTARINSDLVGKFINIASRSASFIQQYFSNQLSDCSEQGGLLTQFQQAEPRISEYYYKLNFNLAMKEIMQLADQANAYVDTRKPWVTVKDANRQAETQSVCTVALNLFRLLSIYLKPVLPDIVRQIETFLNVSPFTWEDIHTTLEHHSIHSYTAIIQRINKDQIDMMKESAQNDLNQNPSIPTITPVQANASAIQIEDFAKVDLRVGKIVQAEAVEGADKLLKLLVDIGEEKPRQIFAGIKSSYQPEQLVNQHVVVVANLAPRTMRFGISEGMILAASDDQHKIGIVQPAESMPPGSKVK